MQNFLDQFYLNFLKDDPLEVSDGRTEDYAADYFFCSDSGSGSGLSGGDCPFQRSEERDKEACENQGEGCLF